MNPHTALFSAVRNISNLYTRAPRPEYWWSLLTLIIIFYAGSAFNIWLFSESWEIGLTKDIVSLGFVLFYVGLICLLISITVRRLHDLDMSGWFACLFILGALGFIVLAIICARKGTIGANRFGLDPYNRGDLKDVEIFD